MSTAPAEVTPEAEPLEEQPGSQPEANEQESAPKGGRRWIWATAVLLFAGLILTLALTLRHRSISKVTQTFAPDPDQVLRLKGTTEAVQARSMLAPVLAGQSVPTLTILRLATGGTRVKAGDLLAEFDRQAQMRDFIDKQADYQKLVDQVAQEEAKEVAARAKDETERTQAENNLHKAELEAQREEILSKIDAEKYQENLQEAKATYDQLRETFDLKRKAAQAAIRILEIQRDRTQQTMQHAQSNANLMQVRAPIDGVVVLNTIWKQGTMGEVQEGDQVEPGTPFMQVVDPASMQVRVSANQQDFPSLAIGQIATIHLDAYPELKFAGKIDQIAPIGEHGSFSETIRVFAVIVAIQGNDPKLMPDLSAAVDVKVGTKVEEPTYVKASADGS